jgi:hypothetical protein
MATTEHHEHLELEKALQAISDWLSSGANEGANFLVTRLTGPIGEGSLFGGADISQWTPGGQRDLLQSNGGTAYNLEFGGGSPVSFTLDASVNLNSGDVALNWTPPSQPPQSSTFKLAYVKLIPPPNGPTYFFDTEATSDQAVYSFTVVML